MDKVTPLNLSAARQTRSPKWAFSCLKIIFACSLCSCSIFDNQNENPKPTNVGWGKFDFATGTFTEPEKLYILDSAKQLNLSSLINSNANYVLKTIFTNWTSPSAKICVHFSVFDESKNTVSSTFPMTLYKFSDSSNKQTYLSFSYDSNGGIQDGKSILLINDSSYDGITYPRVKIMYLPIRTNSIYYPKIKIQSLNNGCEEQ